jgi:indole-3-glycerol phosphate synthase
VSRGAEFLARITDDRRRRVAALKTAVPEATLRARLGEPQPAGRLARALRRDGATGAIRMLCEVKRASPSKGMLNEHVDPVQLASLYQAGGAAAVSLVTEPDHFKGDLGWMNTVRPAVSLPLLLKDFVIDSYQLLDAADRGADAALLLAALLSRDTMERLIGEARTLGLDALVEVHTADEMHAALDAGATIVGINHRNLHTFELDMSLSERLLPLIPASHIAIAESGISQPEELRRLRATRCDAVLMGEVFARAADPAATLAALAAAARGDG